METSIVRREDVTDSDTDSLVFEKQCQEVPSRDAVNMDKHSTRRLAGIAAQVDRLQPRITLHSHKASSRSLSQLNLLAKDRMAGAVDPKDTHNHFDKILGSEKCSAGVKMFDLACGMLADALCVWLSLCARSIMQAEFKADTQMHRIH